MSTEETSAERVPVLVRIPRELLGQIDEFSNQTAPNHRPGSRNASILTLVERGLNDVKRIARDRKRPR